MYTLSELFANYSKEAFRLELLQQYIVPEEWDNFLQFKETGIAKGYSELDEYIESAKEKVKTGKRHIRARVYVRPISEYLKFETQIGYIPQESVGIELLFLEANTFKSLLSALNINQNNVADFWLFDNSILAIMEYDSEGRYLGHKITNDSTIVNQCALLRNEFIKTGHPFSYFLAEQS